jgi:hypothetical protein
MSTPWLGGLRAVREPPLEFGHSPNRVSDAARRLDLMRKPHSEAIRGRVGWAPHTI